MPGNGSKVRQHLRENREEKWGFIVYRCTYGDDAAWEHLMDRLKHNARESLIAEESEDLFDQIDWNVQEDASLDGAGVNEVKKRYREWVSTNYPNGCFEKGISEARTYGCIMVDKQSLKTVTSKQAPPLDEYDEFGKTWVWFVDRWDQPRRKVGISYLMPRAYDLIVGVGWHIIDAGKDRVACPI